MLSKQHQLFLSHWPFKNKSVIAYEPISALKKKQEMRYDLVFATDCQVTLKDNRSS